jgi:hypothetical protein
MRSTIMLARLVLTAVTLAAAGDLVAQQAPPAAQQAPAAATPPQAGASPSDPKSMSGMSILGNQDAPKSLVIVPWKSSEIGNGVGVSRALDTRIRAVDKDVFMRELKYYGIRSGSEK